MNSDSKKVLILNIIAIVSALGIIAWIISDFAGGMILFLFAYPHLIISIIILYLFSAIQTVVSILKKKASRINMISHSAVVVLIIIFNLYNSDLIKSERLITATLKDDLVLLTLVFRKDGSCENRVVGMFGFSKTYRGEYVMKGDTIIFKKKPHVNNFIPDTLLLVREDSAIYMEKDSTGNFITTKEWLNHFKIQ